MLSISPLGLTAVHAASHVASHAAGHAAASAAVTVALQDRPSTSSYGQSVSLIATVTGATTGSVEFFDDGSATPLGTANVSTRGVADYITNTLPLGTNSITAEYFATGATTAGATSTAIPETVNAASTRTAVAAPANPIVAGESATFTATVSSGGSRGATGVPAGTVNFTVSNTAGGAPITGSVAVNGTGKATFTPSTTLAAGTYVVTATFTPSNADYTASSSGVLVETVAAASTVGVGTVSAGTSTAPVSLRGGAQATINVTQAIDATGTVLTETGAGVSYTDAARGISITGATVTAVIFSSNGYQAEIIGTGSNVNGTTTTTVNFIMLVNSGSGQGTRCPASA